MRHFPARAPENVVSLHRLLNERAIRKAVHQFSNHGRARNNTEKRNIVQVSVMFSEVQWSQTLPRKNNLSVVNINPQNKYYMSKIKPISIIQSMSGKVCEHSDMYFRTNRQTGSVSTGKICYPSNTAPTEAQIKAQNRFSKVSAAIRLMLEDSEQKAKYEAAFKAQRRIGTLFGYVFAKVNHLYDENGDPIAA